MKSKKGSVELIFIVLVGLMVWVGSKTENYKKSFASPELNKLTIVDKLNEKKTVMNEFDRTSSSSQVNEIR